MSLFSFSKKTDYGFLFLSELIRLKDSTKGTSKDSSLLSLSTFAQSKNLPLKFLEQVARDLKKARLISSVEGRNGGYFLAKNPEEINLYEVLMTLEGKVEHMECMTSHSKCVHEDECNIKNIWRGIGMEIENILKNKTLADVHILNIINQNA